MKLISFMAPLCLCASALGQGARFDQNVVTSANNVPPGAQAPLFTLPFASVKVCSYPAVGSPCTNVVNVYTDPGLTQPISQPIKADVHGRFGFWASPGLYTYSVSNSGKVLGTYTIALTGIGGGTATFPGSPGLVYSLNTAVSRNAIFSDIFALFSGSCTGTAVPQANGTCGAAGTGTVTDFIASTGSWPAWLVPSVTTHDTTPTLAVSASPIPNSALANSAITINATSCSLGGTCSVPLTGVSSINANNGPFTFSGPGVSCTGTTCTFSGGGGTNPTTTGPQKWTGSAWASALAADISALWTTCGSNYMRGNGTCDSGTGSSMVYPGAGIPNSSGTSWLTSYDATNKIPSTFIPTLNQSTTGNAATATALAATPTLCTTGQAPTGVLANGNATGCASIGGGGISGLTTGKIPVATSSTAIGNGPLDTTTNAGAVTSSQDLYAPAFHSTDTSGAGFGFSGTEGTAVSGASGVDGFWADSTAHRFRMNNNNAGAVSVVGIGTAGTSGHIPVFSSNGVDIQDSGAAGFTGSCASTTTLTVVNGIITGCS